MYTMELIHKVRGLEDSGDFMVKAINRNMAAIHEGLKPEKEAFRQIGSTEQIISSTIAEILNNKNMAILSPTLAMSKQVENRIKEDVERILEW